MAMVASEIAPMMKGTQIFMIHGAQPWTAMYLHDAQTVTRRR
jgi:hypothetical protein